MNHEHPCETHARHLTQSQLRETIDELRRGASLTAPGDRAALEASLASLECEAAARGLALPGPVEEPTPDDLARELFLRALAASDRELAQRALAWVHPGFLFIAVRRIREHASQEFRIHCLRHVLYRMDTVLLGPVPARDRYTRQSDTIMTRDDLEAYVEQCIASLFAVALSQPYQGGAQ